MKNMMIGIISYLPDDPEVREVRKKCLVEQHKFLKETLHLDTSKIVIVTQNWKKDLKQLDYKRVDFKDPKGPSFARNIILKEFYNSEAEWLWCMDDDLIMYPYYDIFNLMDELDSNPEKFKSLDMFIGVFPRYYPFKKNNLEDPNLFDYYTFSPRPINTPGSSVWIRNIKKHNDKEVFYREDVDLTTFSGREDMSFLIDWLKSGFNAYQCNQLIIKNFGDLGVGKSTIFSSDESVYKEQVRKCMDSFLKLHGIKRGLNGQIRWNDFNQLYNSSKEYLRIKREVPIKELDESLRNLRKNKEESNKRRLF